MSNDASDSDAINESAMYSLGGSPSISTVTEYGTPNDWLTFDASITVTEYVKNVGLVSSINRLQFGCPDVLDHPLGELDLRFVR